MLLQFLIHSPTHQRICYNCSHLSYWKQSASTAWPLPNFSLDLHSSRALYFFPLNLVKDVITMRQKFYYNTGCHMETGDTTRSGLPKVCARVPWGCRKAQPWAQWSPTLFLGWASTAAAAAIGASPWSRAPSHSLASMSASHPPPLLLLRYHCHHSREPQVEKVWEPPH